MRADRLVAELLFLQSREKVTATELAEEFEVSVKTARRDLEALSMAGIPVYPERGRNGGWRLLGGAKTNLTGLKSDEARALFFAAAQIDERVHPGLKSALSKVSEALPEPFRAEVRRVGDVVHSDPVRWGRKGSGSPGTSHAMGPLQQAVVERRMVELSYRNPQGASSTRRASPWGLVSKASVWYLIAMTDRGRRTFRLDRITGVVVLDELAEVPDTFDLGEEWDRAQEDFGATVLAFRAEIVAERWTVPILKHLFLRGYEEVMRQPDGKLYAEVSGASAFQVAARLAGLIDGVTVLGPPEVKMELERLGYRLINSCGQPERQDEHAPGLDGAG